MKRTLCMILCLALCVALFAGCGGTKTEAPAPAASTPTEAPSSTGGKAEAGKTNTGGGTTAESKATPPPKEAEYYDELSLYIGDKVAIIDPMNPGAGTSQSGIIDHMAYDTLVYYEIDGSYSPCLATEWTMNDDATVWTFKLRNDVKFHNGEPFTADDVIFTVEKCVENPGNYLANAFNQVAKIEANGDYEVTFTLKSGNFDFIYDVSNPVVVICNREAYESGSETAGWIGTGPFKIVGMVPNDSISYEAFEDYWGEKPLCKKFTMRYIAEETARNIMLENDEFTFCNVSGVYIKQYEQDPRFVINSYVMNNLNYVAFNMRKPLTGDINFRLACAYAMDPEEILDIALDGYGAVAETGAYWGYKTAYKDPSIPQFKQDLDKAKEYLAQSPYNGETVYLTAGMAHTIKAAQVVQAQLQAIGINAEVKQLDGPSMTAATAYDVNDEDIVVGSGAWSPLGSSIKSFVTPGNNSNKACYENQEVVDLIAKASATADGPERAELYYKIQQIMHDELPYYGTFHMALYIAAQKGAGGNVLFPTNYHDYALAYRLKNPA